MLLTGTYDGTIVSWDTSDKVWKPNQEVTQKASVNRLSISEDGLVVAVALSSGVQLYRLPKIELVTTIEEKSNVTSVFFGRLTNQLYYSTENGELFTANESGVRSRVLLFDNNKVDINCAELSPNQSEVYFGDSEGYVKAVNARTFNQTPKNSMFCNKNAAIKALSITPICSMIAAGDALGDLYWWSLSEVEGELVERRKLTAHSDLILALKFSLDAKYLVTASADTTLKAFTIKNKADLVPDKTFYGHSQWVWDLELLADSNHVLSVSSDGFLKCWRLSDGQLLKDSSFTKNVERGPKMYTKKAKFVAVALRS